MHTAWTQDATLLAAILATLLPFVAFVLIMVVMWSCPRLSAGLSIAAVTVSLGCAVFLLSRRTGTWKSRFNIPRGGSFQAI